MAKEETKLRGTTTWERILATLAGMASGLSALVITTHREFDDDVKNIPEVKTQMENNQRRLQTLSREATEHLPKPPDHLDPASWAKARGDSRREIVIKTVNKVKQENSELMDQLVERMGYRSIGFTRKYTVGTIDRLRQMSNRSRGNIIVNSAVAATIFGAGVYMFFNSHTSRENMRQMQKSIDEANNSLERLDRHEHTR